MKHQLGDFWYFLALGASMVFAPGLLHAQPTNDLFANRLVLSGTNITVFASNVGATREIREQYTALAPGGHSVWWEWTAPTNGLATITTTGSDFDTVLGVFTGTPLLSWMSPITDNDDEVYGVVTSKVTFYPDAGETYWIAVDGYDESQQGNIQLNLQLIEPQSMVPWALLNPYGTHIYSSNFAGKVILLNFWATWCSPCLRETPDLIALQEKYRSDGLVVIGADSGESASTVTNFLATETYGINYEIVMAGPLSSTYNSAGFLPTTYLINRQNVIAKQFVGSETTYTLEPPIIRLLYDNVRLSSQRNGNQLVLTWPTSAVTFALDSSPTLKNPVWNQWQTNPAVGNGLNTVTVPASGTNRFFRLRLLQ